MAETAQALEAKVAGHESAQLWVRQRSVDSIAARRLRKRCLASEKDAAAKVWSTFYRQYPIPEREPKQRQELLTGREAGIGGVDGEDQHLDHTRGRGHFERSSRTTTSRRC